MWLRSWRALNMTGKVGKYTRAEVEETKAIRKRASMVRPRQRLGYGIVPGTTNTPSSFC